MKSIDFVDLFLSLLNELREGALGKDLERLIPYSHEGTPDPAGLFVAAFLTGFIVVEGNAGQHGDSAVHKPHDVHKIYVFGVLIEVVAAAFSFFTVKDLGVPKLEEDGF